MDKRSNICVGDAEAFGSFETKNSEYKIFDFGGQRAIPYSDRIFEPQDTIYTAKLHRKTAAVRLQHFWYIEKSVLQLVDERNSFNWSRKYNSRNGSNLIGKYI